MSAFSLSQVTQMDEVVASLQNRNIRSFHHWACTDYDQIEAVVRNDKRALLLIAKTMGWQLPPPSRRKIGFINFLRLMTDEEKLEFIRSQLKGRTLSDVSHSLRAALQSIGAKNLVHLAAGHKAKIKWRQMSDDEIYAFAQNQKASRLRELPKALLAHLYMPGKEDLYIRIARDVLSRTTNFRGRIQIETYIQQLADKKAADADEPRRALNKYLSEYDASAPMSPHNRKLYGRSIKTRGFMLAKDTWLYACRAFTNGFDNTDDGTIMQAYFLPTELFIRMIDTFGITQEDLINLPSFFKFLYKRGLEEYPKGDLKSFEQNLKRLKAERKAEREKFLLKS